MCAVFGLIDYEHRLSTKAKEKILKVLSRECEVRGKDATGYAFNKSDKLTVFKRPLPAHKLKLRLPDNVNVVMGHTRMTTQGNQLLNYNNHPFLGKAGVQQFALAHNGVISNDYLLHRNKEIPDTTIETDSYAAVQLIEKKHKLNKESLTFMAEEVSGSFTSALLDDKETLYIIKGSSPISIIHFPREKLYVYASTEEILWKALVDSDLFRRIKTGEYEVLEVSDGEILQIHKNGIIERSIFAVSFMNLPL